MSPVGWSSPQSTIHPHNCTFLSRICRQSVIWSVTKMCPGESVTIFLGVKGLALFASISSYRNFSIFYWRPQPPSLHSHLLRKCPHLYFQLHKLDVCLLGTGASHSWRFFQYPRWFGSCPPTWTSRPKCLQIMYNRVYKGASLLRPVSVVEKLAITLAFFNSCQKVKGMAELISFEDFCSASVPWVIAFVNCIEFCLDWFKDFDFSLVFFIIRVTFAQQNKPCSLWGSWYHFWWTWRIRTRKCIFMFVFFLTHDLSPRLISNNF